MIFFIPVFIIILGAMLLFIKKIDTKPKKICTCLVTINVLVITFLFLLANPLALGEVTWLIWADLAINIAMLIVLCNNKIALTTKKAVIIMVGYFLLIFLLPTYKYSGHRHEFNNSHDCASIFCAERIVHYTNYYNIYVINIYNK